MNVVTSMQRNISYKNNCFLCMQLKYKKKLDILKLNWFGLAPSTQGTNAFAQWARCVILPYKFNAFFIFDC